MDEQMTAIPYENVIREMRKMLTGNVCVCCGWPEKAVQLLRSRSA